MKRKYSLSILGILLILAMLCSFLALPVSAATEAEAAALAKIDSVLIDKFESMDDTDTIAVSVWFTDIDHNELKEKVENEVSNISTRSSGVSQKAVDLIFLDSETSNSITAESLDELTAIYSDITTEEIQRTITIKRELAAQMHQENNLRIIEDTLPHLAQATTASLNEESSDASSVQYVCSYAPNADMVLTKAEIFEIASNDDVLEINYRSTDIIDFDEETEVVQTPSTLSTTDYDLTFLSVTGLSTARDVWGLSGTGMKVGIVEASNTVNKSYFTNGSVENFEDYNVSGSDHGTEIASIMLGEIRTDSTDSDISYPGAIPSAVLYATSAGGNISGIKGATERLLNISGLNVISSSCGYFITGVTDAYYSDIAKWYDYICENNNIHLALCAGNYRSAVGPFEVVHSNNAYNAVVVGNCDNSGTLYTGNSELEEASLYSQGNTESYKPDIVAPGVNIQFHIYPSSVSSLQKSGTSYSTPMVASAMVQLSQKSSVLFSSPTLMKALLLSSSKITSSMSSEPMISTTGSTSIALSHPYGAGMLNVSNAYKAFVDSANYKKGTFSQYSSGVTYTKSVTKSVGKTIRVCATWDKVISYTELSDTSYTIDDENLDTMKLTVTTPSGTVYTSSYLYDNKQIISFVSTENGTYTFELDRIGSSKSNTTIDYAIAFSVQ